MIKDDNLNWLVLKHQLEVQRRLAPDWQFTGHYAFQRTTDRSTGQAAGYAPRHHLYGRVDWLADHGWAVGLQANRVAGRERAAGEDDDDASSGGDPPNADDGRSHDATTKCASS